MMPKQGYTQDGYYEYTVYPLEGIWDLTEQWKCSNILNKGEFITLRYSDSLYAMV